MSTEERVKKLAFRLARFGLALLAGERPERTDALAVQAAECGLRIVARRDGASAAGRSDKVLLARLRDGYEQEYRAAAADRGARS